VGWVTSLALLQEGQNLRDTYEVERFLGEGAFAEVYRVKHRFLGRQSMKVFKAPGLTLSELEQMLGEAVVLSRLNHSNIVRIFDANVLDVQGQTLGFFTMEYVAGGSLDQFWRSYGQQFIPVNIVIEIVKQVCRGLDVAHSQDPPIIHRDIKPQNILIGYDKDGLRARVSDFGLAKSVNPLTLMASARGTRCFKSPEAFDDFNSDSCAGDVWAIGTTLYLLLTDRLPFDLPEELSGVTSQAFARPLIAPSRLNALSDPRLDQLVLKCLATNPKDRYATAKALLADLECWAPRLSSDMKTSSNSANKLETSKEILGSHSPLNEENARRIALQAIKVSQEVGRLNDAADLMEEAMNRYPALRSEYQGRVKLWRRGIVM
jgi:eukaryotic-like serine/threonine-protein kinase